MFDQVHLHEITAELVSWVTRNICRTPLINGGDTVWDSSAGHFTVFILHFAGVAQTRQVCCQLIKGRSQISFDSIVFGLKGLNSSHLWSNTSECFKSCFVNMWHHFRITAAAWDEDKHQQTYLTHADRSVHPGGDSQHNWKFHPGSQQAVFEVLHGGKEPRDWRRQDNHNHREYVHLNQW